MTAAELYQAIGSAKTEYLEESEERVEMRKVRAAPRVFVIAAVIVILCGITALAAAYSLREAARADMGISEESPIPEWTEYPDEAQTSAVQQETQVKLLASMCAGDQLYAYIAVSPIPEEIAAILATDSPQYEWDLGGANTSRCSWVIGQTDYNAETQTALVKVSVRGAEIQQMEQIELKLALTHNLKKEKLYGPVVIPVMESQMVSCSTDVPVENTKAHFESAWGSRTGSLSILDYTLKGKIKRIAICAGYIEVELETPGLEQWVAASDADRIEIEVPSETPFDMKEWFVKRMFCGSWQVSVNESLQGATLNYRDGTSTVIDEIPSPYAGIWTIMNDTTAGSVYEGRQIYRFTPKQAFDLRAIESVTIGSTVYLFPEFLNW